MAKQALGNILKVVRTTVAAPATDRELMDRFRNGDEAAFATLVKRHSPMVLGVCRRVLPTLQDAEDACQAVFLILAKQAKRKDWQTSIANWLYTTARRTALQANRNRWRRSKHERRATEPESASLLDQMTGREAFATLDEELEKLSAIYREPLVLCYLEGLTRDEAAARLGVPMATLKSQLDRGRKKLNEALTRRGVVLGACLLGAATSGTIASAGTSVPTLVNTILASVGGKVPPTVASLVKGAAVKAAITKVKFVLVGLAAMLMLGFGIGSLPMAAQTQKASSDKMEKPESKNAVSGKPAKTEAMMRTVSGRVVGPDNKGLGKVKLWYPKWKVPEPRELSDLQMVEAGRTDEEGRFQVVIPNYGGKENLIAYHEGYGIDWVSFHDSTSTTKPVELKLVEDLPITGKVLSTEGKPIPGVRVSISGIAIPKDEKLDDFLAGWMTNLQEILTTPEKRLYCSLEGIVGHSITDAEGRYKLRGVGKERLATILFEGAGIARSQPQLVTRKGFDPKPYNEVLLKSDYSDLRVLNRFLGLIAPDHVLIAEPGRVIEGRILEANGGKPIAGCGVSVMTGYDDGMTTTSDHDGKYRFEGVPKRSIGYRVFTYPAKNSPYLAAIGNSSEIEGFGPVSIDIRLAKGVTISGRVIDRATGKGVPAGIRLAPLPENKFYGKSPGSDSYRTDRTSRSTDAEGRFHLETIPGEAILLVQAEPQEKLQGMRVNPYRQAQPEPDHRSRFRYDANDNSWNITAVDQSIEFLGNAHAAKIVNIPESGELKVEVFVERGTTARIEVRDEGGQPLPGAWLAGMTDTWPIAFELSEATATIYALDPAKPRTLALYHPEKKLGGIATIRGDEKEKVVVKLAPLGTVSGQLKEFDVQLSGAEISVNSPKMVFSELYRFARQGKKPSVTDANGRFTLEDVVPGMEFYLQIRKGEQYFSGKPKIGQMKLAPGEKKELGERTVETIR